MAKAKKTRRDPSAQRAAHPSDPHGRSQVMATRVSPLEQQRIITAAISVHLSASDFLRQAALGAQVMPAQRAPMSTARPAHILLVRELNAIGVNLNQLTRVAHASGFVPSGLVPLLDELNRILEQLMQIERSS